MYVAICACTSGRRSCGTTGHGTGPGGIDARQPTNRSSATMVIVDLLSM
jgi:hypothetical protein